MTVEPLPLTLLHDRMAEWWRPFTLDLDGQIVERRRRGIQALRASLAPANAVDAVAYAHGDAQAGERIIETVRAGARTADPFYRGQVGDAEPPALVAAALVDQLAVDPASELSALIALLVLSAAHSHASPTIPSMPLPEYAARALEQGSAIRRRSATPARQTAGELVRELLAGSEHPPAADHAESHANGHGNGSTRTLEPAAVKAIAARIDDLANGADREIGALREQLRQQTWAADPNCRTAGAPWAEIDPAARPLLAAVELAEHTDGITPAPSAQALLGRILAEPTRAFGLDEASAVAAAGPLLGGRLARAPHPLLFPLCARLAQWRAEQEQDVFDTRRAFASLHEDPADEIEIAMQGYREALALRALGDD